MAPRRRSRVRPRRPLASRPGPRRPPPHPRPDARHRPNRSIVRQTHRPPILSRRRCGVALAAYGARRAYLAGIAAGRASAAPSPHPRRRKGEKAHPSDDDDDDDEGDDDPSSRPTPGPAHSTANGDVPPTPIGKKGALQQAAAAAAASTTPPCTPPGGPERASTPGEWRDKLTGRPRSNAAAAEDDDDDRSSAVDLVATYDRIQREFTEANGAFDPVAVADAARWFHFEPPARRRRVAGGIHQARASARVHPAGGAHAGGRAGGRGGGGGVREGGDASDARGRVLQRLARRLPRHRVFPVPPDRPGGGSHGWCGRERSRSRREREKKSREAAIGFHPDHDAEEAAVHDALRGAVDVAPKSIGDASINRNGSTAITVCNGSASASKSHRENGSRRDHARGGPRGDGQIGRPPLAVSGPGRRAGSRAPRAAGRVPGSALEADGHRALHAPEGVSEGKLATVQIVTVQLAT